jgi:hypothetical protein
MQLSRHQGKCFICNGDQQKEIEAEYFAGLEFKEIDALFGIPRNCLRNHAIALGLEERRVQHSNVILRELLSMSMTTLRREGFKTSKEALTVGLKIIELMLKVDGQLKDVTIDLSAEMEGKSDAECVFYAANGWWPTKDDLEKPEIIEEVEGVH